MTEDSHKSKFPYNVVQKILGRLKGSNAPVGLEAALSASADDITIPPELQADENNVILRAFYRANIEEEDKAYFQEMTERYHVLRPVRERFIRLSDPLEEMITQYQSIKSSRDSITAFVTMMAAHQENSGVRETGFSPQDALKLIDQMIDSHRQRIPEVIDFYSKVVNEAKKLAAERGLNPVDAMRDQKFRFDVVLGRVLQTPENAQQFYEKSAHISSMQIDLVGRFPQQYREQLMPNMAAVRFLLAAQAKYHEKMVENYFRQK